MSDLLNRNRKSFSSSANQSADSMHFWGICCESGKRYAQVVGKRFRLTNAVLDPKSFCKENKIVTLNVIRDSIEYLLCVLKHGELHQVPLNLIFDKGENVVFYINGSGKVCLSGYQLSESGADTFNDECPLVELKSKLKKEKNVEPEASTSKGKKKQLEEAQLDDEETSLWIMKLANEAENGEADEDDSDSDFSANVEEESESSDESESEESDEGWSDDDLAQEIDVNDLEDDERALIMEGRKRKRQSALLAQKRAKKKSVNSDSVENEVVEIKEDDKGSDVSMTSAANANNEPAPSQEKKKKKKKKKLADVSQIAETSQTQSRIKKLEGGVEIDDVVVGKGPVATKGKMVHVYYVGRFKDKTIFDSRTPGKKPFSFKLGIGHVIKGWDIGLVGMRVGGRRRLKIPPNMAYGSARNSGIPPDSTLFFTVELQNVS